MIEKILSLADSVAIRTLQGVATLEDDHIAYLLLAFGCCCLLETRGPSAYRHTLLLGRDELLLFAVFQSHLFLCLLYLS